MGEGVVVCLTPLPFPSQFRDVKALGKALRCLLEFPVTHFLGGLETVRRHTYVPTKLYS